VVVVAVAVAVAVAVVVVVAVEEGACRRVTTAVVHGNPARPGA
jgi:hypothetical protein